ncbi:hypothetical protein JCM30237_09620 [Halolamina litorea]|uniref:DUF6276 family protein n=1 Tax=Halolamina litorea TaxID=1515593 RepID=A0ABD6BUS7_9EURY|nr:DUF6276 family protein [Halolamina litorea]
MACPACGGSVVAFRVPASLREHAPADETAICSVCLRTMPASEIEAGADAADPDEVDFSGIDDSFPSGRAGVAFALLLGKLDSLALERQSIEELCEAAERAGTDVRLALERLALAEGLEPQFDIERRTSQLASFR